MSQIIDAKLNERQKVVLTFIEAHEFVSMGKIFEHVQKFFEKITRITVSRDLEKLLELHLIERRGESKRTIVYAVASYYLIGKDIDVDAYFSVDTDQREVKDRFDFAVFEKLHSIFTDSEKEKLSKLNGVYRQKIKNIAPDIFKKEIERLNIDFSWKSSKIEGNTYDLLETEQLFKNHEQAPGHTQEEATMILNHKIALEYIRNNKEDFREMATKKIEDIHILLTQDLGVTKNLRKTLVRVTGTKYRPLENEFQIREALEKTCQVVNGVKNEFEKAVVLMLLVAYIQPFADGNKRTSRLSGNAVLQAFDACPLSYRSMDEVEYKKAILLFYEQNNISYFKKLFLKQFEFAVENYFG